MNVYIMDGLKFCIISHFSQSIKYSLGTGPQTFHLLVCSILASPAVLAYCVYVNMLIILHCTSAMNQENLSL